MPQRTMRLSIARVSEQLDPPFAASRYKPTTVSISHTALTRSYYSFSVPKRVGGWVDLKYAVVKFDRSLNVQRNRTQFVSVHFGRFVRVLVMWLDEVNCVSAITSP